METYLIIAICQFDLSPKNQRLNLKFVDATPYARLPASLKLVAGEAHLSSKYEKHLRVTLRYYTLDSPPILYHFLQCSFTNLSFAPPLKHRL